MSCLFACFSTSKHERRRRRQLLNATSPNHHLQQRNGVSEAIQSAESLKQEDFHIPITPLKVSEEKVGEREILNWNGKKVSFNLNVKTLGELSAGGEVTDNLLKKDGENENQKEETSKETKCSVSDLTVSSSVCKPQKNNRYQDCAESDGECEDLGMEEEGLDVDNGGSEAGSDKKFIIEESSESLFSLSIESREQVVEAELDDKEVTSPMQMGKSPSEELKPMGLNRDARDRSQYVDSVLNPVENLAQWKAVKVKASTPLQQQGKENIILEEEFDMAFSSKAGRNETMLVDKEIAVDTSLSSWLVGSETTPVSNASSNSVGNSQPKKVNGDRCILGVLVMEELKQHSVPVSRSGSKGWSPDETPVIGTIGSYWSHTGQAVDSNSRSPSKGTPNLSRRIEDEGVKWNATPFEARLEGALDKIVAAEV